MDPHLSRTCLGYSLEYPDVSHRLLRQFQLHVHDLLVIASLIPNPPYIYEHWFLRQNQYEYGFKKYFKTKTKAWISR